LTGKGRKEEYWEDRCGKKGTMMNTWAQEDLGEADFENK